MSVAEAQRKVSAREFAEWMAYDRLDPIGRERDDWRAAALLTMLANLNRKKGRKPYTLKDFWPQWHREEPDEDELRRKIDATMKALQGLFADGDAGANPTADRL
ncbi:MAG: DUF4035 domain-containing protein [Dehalococcoidia bacterium]|nr:DUF4035 domain-containing protein [Dehalococcoidia bacterium]